MTVSRMDIARRCAEEGIAYLAEVAGPTFNELDEPGIGLGLLRTQVFPGMRVSVDEAVELTGGRVLMILVCHATESLSWPAIMILGFRDDRVVSSWTLQDPTVWMDALPSEE